MSRCFDVDGLPNVVIIEVAYCGDCGRRVVRTATGWHHTEETLA